MASNAGDGQLCARATANAKLYRFITTGDRTVLGELDRALAPLSEIERIGTRQEMIPVAPLAAEIQARLAEVRLAALGESPDTDRAQGHLKASDAFKPLFSAPLITYQYHHDDQHRDTGQQRFFYHQGLANWFFARAVVLESPEKAAEHMAKALGAFRQCHDDDWAGKAQTWLDQCRRRRTCWSCNREFQGAGIHFRTYSARVTPYAASVVTQLNQDSSALDSAADQVVLCTPCGTVLHREADRVAAGRTDALRTELNAALTQMQRTVLALASRVDALERR
jgi:hypothetical protein